MTKLTIDAKTFAERRAGMDFTCGRATDIYSFGEACLRHGFEAGAHYLLNELEESWRKLHEAGITGGGDLVVEMKRIVGEAE